MSAWEIVEFDPNAASRSEWDAYHAYRRIRHNEVRPEDPMHPDDEVEKIMKRENPFAHQRRFAVRAGDRTVGFAGAFTSTSKAPEYETNKHLMWADAGVLKEFRRRGIGRGLLAEFVKAMRDYNNTVLTTSTEEEDGHAFLKWLGAEHKQVQVENRLDFRKIDWEMVTRWVAEANQKNPDTRLDLYEDRLPDEVMREFCPVLSDFLNTMPFDDLDHGDIVVTPETMRKQYEYLDDMKGDHHTIILREPDGSISGTTDVLWTPSKPTFIEQQFTGVRPEERGRGLGKWIKARMLDYLRRYESLEWVVTGNAGSNAAMLGINHALGFREHKRHGTYQIGIEGLEARLAAT